MSKLITCDICKKTKAHTKKKNVDLFVCKDCNFDNVNKIRDYRND